MTVPAATQLILSQANTGEVTMSHLRVVKSPRRVTLQKAVCDAFEIPEDRLFERRRYGDLVDARKCYVYILMEIEGNGPTATARHMGYKAHETAYNACVRCNQHYHKEPEFRARMDQVLDLYNQGLIDLPIQPPTIGEFTI